MPNKRDPDQVQLNTWVDKELKAQIQALAEMTGRTPAELVREIMEHEVERRIRENPQKYGAKAAPKAPAKKKRKM